jgi:hypothetical protein
MKEWAQQEAERIASSKFANAQEDLKQFVAASQILHVL